MYPRMRGAGDVRWVTAGLLLSVLSLGVCSARLMEDLHTQTVPQLLSLDVELNERTTSMQETLAQLEEEANLLSRNETELEKDLEDALKNKERVKTERENSEVELVEAKKEVKTKREDISRLSVHIAEIRKEADTLRERIEVTIEKIVNRDRDLNEPSLSQVLDNNKDQWGEVPRSLYSKSQKVIGPISGLRMKHESHTPTWKSLSLAVLIYTSVLTWLYIAYRIYNHLQGRLTIARLLFLGDAINCCFWILVLSLSTVLSRDVFEMIAVRHESAFFLLQMVLLVYYTSYIMVRVLLLAARLNFLALIELLTAIVLGHHYYITVWVPSLIGEEITNNMLIYFCYMGMYLILALLRLYTFPPLYDPVAASQLGSILRLKKRSRPQRKTSTLP
mmetsp:Transcript_11917/g.36318  ORF Transcript_11917/g.36318 Transcript_11917/m.36318 type:complete len:391 (+) Transcript_11917:227-1399(+)